MHPAPLIETPPPITTQAFGDGAAAVARLEEIYERNTGFLRNRFEAYVNGVPFTADAVKFSFDRAGSDKSTNKDKRTFANISTQVVDDPVACACCRLSAMMLRNCAAS